MRVAPVVRAVLNDREMDRCSEKPEDVEKEPVKDRRNDSLATSPETVDRESTRDRVNEYLSETLVDVLIDAIKITVRPLRYELVMVSVSVRVRVNETVLARLEAVPMDVVRVTA